MDMSRINFPVQLLEEKLGESTGGEKKTRKTQHFILTQHFFLFYSYRNNGPNKYHMESVKYFPFNYLRKIRQ